MNSPDMLKFCQTFWELSDKIQAEIKTSDDQKRSLDETERLLRRYLRHLQDQEDQGNHLVK